MGVPLAQLIFGAHTNLGLILLPIMFYHPFQLFVCGLLANRFATQTEAQVIDNQTTRSSDRNGLASEATLHGV